MDNQISFFLKDATDCPVCENKFHIEVLRSGRGRLNTAKLEMDLRRSYIPSKQFGHIYPLIYNIVVCPNCWFACFKEHFHKDIFNYKEIKAFQKQRIEQALYLIKTDFIDFNQSRNLESGLVSFFLAMHCYNFIPQNVLQEFCRGLCALRASWVIKDICEEKKDLDFNYLLIHFRYLARVAYEKTLICIEGSNVDLSILSMGPDIDHDYKFNGIVYMTAFLDHEFIELIKNDKEKIIKLEQSAIKLSKVFAVGKISRQSPSLLVEKVLLLYDDIKESIEKFKAMDSDALGVTEL